MDNPPIDHFGASNRTFQQRYSIFDEFYKPGGPIMFFQGEEGWLLDCANITVINQQRCFQQQGHNCQWFLRRITRCGIPLKPSRYLFGSLAAAGAVKAFSNSSDPDTYNWWRWVNQIYLDRSKEAADKIQNAFTVLQKRLQTIDDGGVSLEEELILCSAPSSNDSVGNFLLVLDLTTVFSFAAEINYPTVQLGRNPVADPLDKIINIVLTETDPVQILSKTFWLWFGAPGPSNALCLNYTDPGFIMTTVPLIETAPFNYITCNYLPLASSNIPEGTIFPAFLTASDSQPQACKLKYSHLPMTQEETSQRYHFSPESIKNSTRIIWSNA
ncbi:peptidase S28 [Annulohypoxylon truncatum]|uniref:peptidase S28 n=1 Tax=Annulohypoxylon truncatum TaxID=327061 RepID=UPI002008AAF6|nr:peptidase S28 [Annulohypoxylon truncatum]KAI1205261.1 peptidase S28 [Annulohypoxylon truncatum]